MLYSLGRFGLYPLTVGTTGALSGTLALVGKRAARAAKSSSVRRFSPRVPTSNRDRVGRQLGPSRARRGRGWRPRVPRDRATDPRRGPTTVARLRPADMGGDLSRRCHRGRRARRPGRRSRAPRRSRRRKHRRTGRRDDRADSSSGKSVAVSTRRLGPRRRASSNALTKPRADDGKPRQPVQANAPVPEQSAQPPQLVRSKLANAPSAEDHGWARPPCRQTGRLDNDGAKRQSDCANRDRRTFDIGRWRTPAGTFVRVCFVAIRARKYARSTTHRRVAKLP